MLITEHELQKVKTSLVSHQIMGVQTFLYVGLVEKNLVLLYEKQKRQTVNTDHSVASDLGL